MGSPRNIRDVHGGSHASAEEKNVVCDWITRVEGVGIGARARCAFPDNSAILKKLQAKGVVWRIKLQERTRKKHQMGRRVLTTTTFVLSPDRMGNPESEISQASTQKT